jgi:hypothetical protein
MQSWFVILELIALIMLVGILSSLWKLLHLGGMHASIPFAYQPIERYSSTTTNNA